MAARLPPHLAPVATGEGTCRLTARVAESVEWLAVRLALTGCDFTLHGPDALVAHVAELGRACRRRENGRRPGAAACGVTGGGWMAGAGE